MDLVDQVLDASAAAIQGINPLVGPAPTEAALPIPLEYQSFWYMSPRRHAAELWVYVLLYSPLWCFLLRKALQTRQWRKSPPVRAPTSLDVTLGLCAFVSLAMQLYYKIHAEGSWRVPYMWQPCHVLTAFLCFNCFVSSRFSEGLFNVGVSLGWSSLFAIVFPDLSDYEYYIDMANYGFEHIIMLFIPFVLVKTGRFQLQTSWYWIWFGYLCTITYHAFCLFPLGVYTHINLATFISPPPPLAFAGEMYRPAQFAFCALVHAVYNFLVQWSATPFPMPPPGESDDEGEGKKWR